MNELNQQPKQQLAPFTVKNVLLDIYNGIIFLSTNPQANIIIYPIIICLSSIITKVIIYYVSYTEIDYKTYLQQIEVIEDYKVLDYTKIFGDSGPIVYPGGFVTIYSWIRYFTSGSIEYAQSIFGYLFVACVIFTCVIYSYLNVQPWVIFLFLLSKRTLSIFVLRLFNDCWVSICILGMMILLQQANQEPKLRILFLGLAADIYSIAISIKMNALLYLPAFIIITYFLTQENALLTIGILSIIPIIQVLMGWKFLLIFYNDELSKKIRWNYIKNAFNFGRKFLYKWTVNWKFLNEDIFNSDIFATILLILHVVTLLIFIFGKFLSPKVIGKSRLELFKDVFKWKKKSSMNMYLDVKVGPSLIFYTLTLTNLIGILFARSLHYQFLSWYNFQLPAIIYLNVNNIFIGMSIWILHESCWLVFPSTIWSSGLLITILSGLIISSWFNFDKIIENSLNDKEIVKKNE
ncbi:unnamed protein product [Candida verbasci]|uniref:Dol-P-Man:Man(5)GlcNAc(2)-PP-Dol alpha-1,3-mannosyltransferase n=1 Tax=Candida verbasci TaxID=1227364 RepID=A0A9W4XCF6_9ASCO|nr:unnamed protein product [Candida verbasci]